MFAALLLFAAALSQETEEARRAIEIVRKAEGKVVFDAKAPGKRVIAINL